LQPDILLAGSTPASVALQRETRTIPIVFVNVVDPVVSGFVPRLDRPSVNITGLLKPRLRQRHRPGSQQGVEVVKLPRSQYQ
jgi:ABC-type uncharacterized transport system substrate-binding protein